MARILIIDDEAGILQLMTKLCRQQGHDTTPVQTGREGIEALDRLSPDLMIVDLLIGDMNGLEVIEYSQQHHPDTQVIMVTGHGSIETAVEAMRLGAFDYLTKPFELADLQRTVELALQQKGKPKSDSKEPAPEFDISLEPAKLIGQSPKMQEIFGIIEKIANNDSPVLLEGEFGSGKQMVARSIHNSSRRNHSPFKVLQCSALPEELLEMELFGLPSSRSETIFNRAMGGTVLLEEIHMLPMRLQSQLESYLEEINVRRMTNTLPAYMDVRFIASSAKPLEECIEDGGFREDLFYKISVIPIQVPALRTRKEDIPLLIEYFLDRYASRTGTSKQEVDKYAERLLEQYGWPGNVGELQNAVERACAFSEKNRIRPVDLPPKVAQKVEITDDDEQTTHQLPIGTKLAEFIKKQEKLFIRETLKYNGGSREKTASMLGVSIATLYRKMGLKLERDKMLNN
ncbi:MAG: sigma-54-dependent Fis family transcriptional regulator [Verrucomicrobiae bacterium]|nr:sigma-54-dependent Fis family transcriptional regulator [Verrucomicrobiae bacterium]MCP5540454.1 sigma-54-dependent Fis family transcriptional regulator [Akkermansiaceae bacterium]